VQLEHDAVEVVQAKVDVDRLALPLTVCARCALRLSPSELARSTKTSSATLVRSAPTPDTAAHVATRSVKTRMRARREAVHRGASRCALRARAPHHAQRLGGTTGADDARALEMHASSPTLAHDDLGVIATRQRRADR